MADYDFLRQKVETPEQMQARLEEERRRIAEQEQQVNAPEERPVWASSRTPYKSEEKEDVPLWPLTLSASGNKPTPTVTEEVATTPTAPTVPWQTTNPNAQDLEKGGYLKEGSTSEGYVYTDPKTGKKVYKAWRKTLPTAPGYREEIDAGAPIPGTRIVEAVPGRALGSGPGTYATDPLALIEFSKNPPPFSEPSTPREPPQPVMDETQKSEIAADFFNQKLPEDKSADPSQKAALEKEWLDAWHSYASANRAAIQNMDLSQYKDFVRGITGSMGQSLNYDVIQPYILSIANQYMPAKAKQELQETGQLRSDIQGLRRQIKYQTQAEKELQKAGITGMTPTMKGMKQEKEQSPEKMRKYNADILKANYNVELAQKNLKKVAQQYGMNPDTPVGKDAISSAQDALNTKQIELQALKMEAGMDEQQGQQAPAQGGTPTSVTTPKNLPMQQFVSLFVKEYGRQPSQTEIQKAMQKGIITAGQ
jgi:hypothetical protein